MNNRTRFVRRAVALLGTFAILAAACGPTPGPTGGASPGAPAEQAQKGGRVIEGGFSDIRTLQPILVSDVPSDVVSDMMYDGLITADPQSGEPKENMATFTAAAGGKSYSFVLKADVNWSDGKPVIAEDFATGVKAVAKSKKTVRKNLVQNIVGFQDYVDGKAETIAGIKIDPADPKKFTVDLAAVQCDGILQFTSYTLPTQVFGKYLTATSADAIDTAPENDSPTVWNGPFGFKEWRKGDQVILTRNESYWQGAPNVDEYVYKVVADATVIAAQLKTGEINYYPGLEPKDLADMETQSHVKIDRTSQLGYTYIGWRTDSPTVPAFADVRVRQALAYGLNMADVVTAVLFGEGEKQIAHHVPVQWAYPDPASLQQYAYDPAKAEALLKEAGYAKDASGIYAKDGRPISFTIRTNAGNKTRETLAQVASEQYKAIGIDAKTQFEAFQGLVTQLTEGHQSIEAVIIGWALGTAVDPHGIWHSSQIPNPATKVTGFGFTGFKSAELDKIIEDGRSPANGDCSVATRKALYVKFNQILNEQQPYNFGFRSKILHVSDATMQNYKPGAFAARYNIHEWWFKK